MVYSKARNRRNSRSDISARNFEQKNVSLATPVESLATPVESLAALKNPAEAGTLNAAFEIMPFLPR